MKFVHTLLIGCLFGCMASCAEAPQGAPSSANQAVSPSSDGLFKLFERECVKQTDLKWATAESKRIVATCGGVLGDFLGDGDCKESVAGDVSWLVPTTSHSTVLVNLNWGREPSKVMCSISTAENLSTELRQTATRVATSLGLAAQPVSGQAEPAAWSDSLGGGPSNVPPRLQFRGNERVYGEVRLDTQGQWGTREVALQKQHPTTLMYRGW